MRHHPCDHVSVLCRFKERNTQHANIGILGIGVPQGMPGLVPPLQWEIVQL